MTDQPAAAASATPDAPRPMHRVTGYAWYALAVFVLVYALNFIDRQVLSILAESVKKDFDLDDAQLGFLYGTAFAVFYALFGIPLGRLADSWYRGRLMAIGLALWSTMTAASGLAAGFTGLAIARIGVGIGEASASPAAYSMISDYFPKEKRATALSIYSSGLYIGGGLSLPIGGFVLSEWAERYPVASAAPFGLAPWQAAFMAVGLPGILVAFWVWTLKEPLRGESDGQPSPVVRPNAWREFGKELGAIMPPLTLLSVARIPGALRPNLIALVSIAFAASLLWQLTGDGAQWAAYAIGVYAVYTWTQSLKARDPATHRLIWGTPVTILLAAAFGSIAFITYAVSFWTPPYILRTFYTAPTDAALLMTGMTAAKEVSTIVGWSAAFAAAVGVILGGFISDAWRKRTPPAACSSALRAYSSRSRELPGPSPPTTSQPSTGWCPIFRWWAAAGLARRSRPCRIWSCRGCARPRARPRSSARRWSGLRSGPMLPAPSPRPPAASSPGSPRSTSSRRSRLQSCGGRRAGSKCSKSPAKSAPRRRLLRSADHRASHPAAAVAAWVGLVIVGIGMDHQRCSVGIHDRGRTLAQFRRWNQELAAAGAARADLDVQQVAHVRALWIVLAMFAAGRVPMGAGCLEQGNVAHAGCVNMHAVDSRRQAAHRDSHDHVVSRFLEDHRAGLGSVAGNQGDRRSRRCEDRCRT